MLKCQFNRSRTLKEHGYQTMWCCAPEIKAYPHHLTPLVTVCVFQTSTILNKSFIFRHFNEEIYLHFYLKKKLSILIALLLQPFSVNMYKYKNTSLTYSLAGVQYEHGCFSNLFITSLSEQWNHNRQTSCRQQLRLMFYCTDREQTD